MIKHCALVWTLALYPAAAVHGAGSDAADLRSRVMAQGGEVESDDGGDVVGVRFGFTWVADGDLDHIAGINSLKRLDLSLTRITDLGIERLRPLTGIEELNLYACEHISDTSLAHLRHWKNLRRLNLRGTDITDTGLAYVASHHHLEALDISVTQVTDNGMEHLAELTELRELTLGANKITALGLHVLQLLPNLKKLSLSGLQMRNSGFWSVAVTDLDIDVITQLDQLEHLDAADLKLTDLGVKKMAALRRLRSLDLSRTQISEAGVAALTGIGELRTLHLAGVEEIDDEAAKHLTALGRLTTLDLSSTKVSDKTLRVLSNLPNLKTLYLDDTMVSAEGVREFRDRRPHCEAHWSGQHRVSQDP